jgi:Spy/CpxP family protein refolding chaperone
MNVRTRTGALLALTFLTLGAAAFAQPDAPAPDDPARKEELRERIRTVRTLRLIESLRLDEQRAAAVTKVIKHYDEKQAEVWKKKKEESRNLRKLVDAEKIDEAGAKKGIAALQRADEELMRLRGAEFQELSKQLTITQQAKYLLFKQDFHHAMRDAIHEGRGRRNPENGKPRPSGGNDRRKDGGGPPTN